jgi:thiamine biosynthesis lipoprotein
LPSTRAINRRQLLTFQPSPPPLRADGHWLRVHRRAMACRFEVVLPGEDARHVPAARAALDIADRLEAQISVFRSTSELSGVNRCAANEATEVSRPLFSLLRRAAKIHEATDGAFDITSTPLSRCWGFLHREGRLPDRAAIADALTRVGMKLVTLDESSHTVRFAAPGVELNLGAIGKGYALDVMAKRLRRSGVQHALLSAGASSILAIGDDGGGWPVHIRPRLLDGVRVARLRLRDAAIATSGTGEQFVVVDGQRYGHVLDPRTGWPASGVLSATVVTRDAALADALSTAILVEGPALAQRYCERHPDTLVLMTLDDDPECTSVVGRCRGALIEED